MMSYTTSWDTIRSWDTGALKEAVGLVLFAHWLSYRPSESQGSVRCCSEHLSE